MQEILARIVALLFCAVISVTANPAPTLTTATCATCWTRTTTLAVSCPTATFNPATCVHPDCILLTSTTVGTKSCSSVVTVTPKCPTACSGGCGTSTSTFTYSGKCIPSKSCYTETTTSYQSRVCPVAYFVCTTTPTGCGPATVTVTQAGPPPGATCTVTSTVTTPSTCPSVGCGCRTTTVTTTAR